MSKQYSVQQQNALTQAAITQTAAWWRARPLPDALRQCAASHGVTLGTALMLDLQLAWPGMPAVYGKLLSADGHFIHFEMDLDDNLHPLPGSVAWRGTTSAPATTWPYTNAARAWVMACCASRCCRN